MKRLEIPLPLEASSRRRGNDLSTKWSFADELDRVASCIAASANVAFIQFAATGTKDASSIRSHKVKMLSTSSSVNNGRSWVAILRTWRNVE